MHTPSLKLSSAFLAIAFLAIVTIPQVVVKLRPLAAADVRYEAADNGPACVPSGLCLQFRSSGRAETTASGVRVPALITGVDSLFQIAELMDSGGLKAGREGGASAVRIVPQYRQFRNVDEASQSLPVYLHADRSSAQEARIFLQQGESRSASRALSLTVRSAGLADWFTPRVAMVTVGLILLLLVASSLVEAKTIGATPLGRLMFSAAFLLRLIAAIAAANSLSGIPFVWTVVLILLPWLLIVALSSRLARRIAPSAARGLDHLDQSLHRVTERPSPTLPRAVALAALSAVLAIFAYCLWFSDSFRWSIFEERDFLEARQLLEQWTFPLFGPQLLGGGATPGGILYILLAPAVALWNDPRVLHPFNQILFLTIPFLIWWTLRTREPAGALFGAIAFCSSQIVIGLSSWPIHPNFSLAAGFLYAFAVIRGAVDGHKGWLVASGLLLGVLIQLHFSYFMLLPCHVLLVVFANCRGRFTKTAAIAAVFALLIPTLIADGLAGFANLRQIFAMPRFHPDYVPSDPAGNTNILRLTMEWLRQLPGLWSETFARGLALIAAVGAGSAIFWLSAARNGESRLTLPVAAALLCCVPLLCLSALGMGYNSRHTLSIVPGLFLLVGIGFGTVMRMLPTLALRTLASAVVVLGFLVVVGARAADNARLKETAGRYAEWAVDYDAREAVANELITQLGVTPEIYQSRVYWWWMGWSIAPEIFADEYRKFLKHGRRPERSAALDDFFLIISSAEVPLVLQSAFEIHESRRVGPLQIYRATPKTPFRNPPPSGNADTGVRLHPFLRQVDLINQPRPGFVSLAREATPTVERALFLGTVAEGRIKILITTRRDRAQQRLHWCVDSPSLNGHYQEIKTLWRPRLIVMLPEAAEQFPLGRDVLGNLLYKTPQCGEARITNDAPVNLYFAVDGVFDQSFMERPKLSTDTFRINNAGTINSPVISPSAAVAWMRLRAPSP